MQSYILTVYVPNLLLVIIAWLSFWIDAEAAPARVALGVTTILTVTTMTTNIQETLPVVTYVKVNKFIRGAVKMNQVYQSGNLSNVTPDIVR